MAQLLLYLLKIAVMALIDGQHKLDGMNIGDTTLGVKNGAHDYAFASGAVLGEYRLVAPLGAGGMGEVYLAEHVHMHKQYAVKVLSRGLSHDA